MASNKPISKETLEQRAEQVESLRARFGESLYPSQFGNCFGSSECRITILYGKESGDGKGRWRHCDKTGDNLSNVDIDLPGITLCFREENLSTAHPDGQWHYGTQANRLLTPSERASVRSILATLRIIPTPTTASMIAAIDDSKRAVASIAA